jgi:hypothetical protein
MIGHHFKYPRTFLKHLPKLHLTHKSLKFDIAIVRSLKIFQIFFIPFFTYIFYVTTKTKTFKKNKKLAAD